jgi:hypothetical protein
MRNLLKNRTALSTVVTTLIILVVSVLLAGVVTYFAINVTSTRVQEESLNLAHQHVWYSVSGSAGEAAIIVVNTGGRDVVIDKIAVRGQTAVWTTQVYYFTTATPITTDLNYSQKATPFVVKYTNGTLSQVHGKSNATQTTGSITLKSGYTMVVYITSPDSISVNDIGLSVAISIFSAQATYYKETNVEASY